MKKILKITGIVLLVLVLLLAASPFLFRGKLEDLLKKTINNNLTAQVEWESMDLSLFRSFPDATVIVNNFTVIPEVPFSKDTLLMGRRIQLEMGVKQLFKNASQDPIKVDALTIDDAVLNILVDKNKNTNYDITKEASQDTLATPFVFNLQQYTINNSTINYKDLSNKTHLHLTKIHHQGSGDFSAIAGELNTETMAMVSLDYDNINYLDNHELKLNAVFEMDLDQNKYTFKENTAFINQLPLEFNGYVQLVDDGTAMDIAFKTPDSDFKNFLAVIPSTYRSNLDGVQTSGDFRVSGIIKGKTTDTTIPNLDISIISNNASFKFPQLPKGVSNINLDIKVINNTGIAEETFIEINDARFMIEQDAFTTNGTLRNLTGNMLVDLAVKGTIDLSNIEKAYPVKLDTPLQGRLVTDMTTAFDMNSIEKKQYQNIKSTGVASLSNFQYATEDFPNPITVSKAQITFNTANISLNSFAAKSGTTDINATGNLQNLIPFMISDEVLKGSFKVTSNVFNLNDFVTTKTTVSTDKTLSRGNSAIKIPAFLDAYMDFKAKKVIYDNLELTNARGTLSIANEQAEIKGLNSGIFGGEAGLSGNVTSRGGKPTFSVILDLKKIDIDQSFKNLKMLQGLAPIAKALKGGLNTNINVSGDLDESFSPVLNTISGDAFAQLLTAKVNPEQMPLLKVLNSKLNFMNLSDINLDNLQTALTFSNGKVAVKPFDFDVKGIKVNVSGGHSFTNDMNYTLGLDVPAKYFGSDLGQLLSKLTEEEQEGLTVILPVTLSGKFTSPNVSVNTKAAISSLTAKIVEIQKKKVKNKAGDKINDVLGDILGNGQKKPTDTTNTSTIDPPVNTDAVIKDVAKDIIGGLFGKKKPVKEVKKDTVN
ncbi:AsmA-like C-terminal region-containing protein [Dokdonia sp. Hel_I_53]|uniref:AsmA-like C-terminal region-containing protein n=1 Tax=Dokdonia sp. Hel_I_53 TaxID=1566287 RepID=UPI00119A526B|nr:AsmA-like C-terminal region-containing protein [Dokdonia sp. Hel_I_53]TVZ52950.1 AsmA-like protein [Dokdonia sp. Hel_I_53]